MPLHPAAEWALEELGSVVDAQPDDSPLRRVDRDTSTIYDGGGSLDMAESMRRRTEDLKASNLVGVSFANRGGDLVGTEPLRDVDVVLSVRIEGLHTSEFGHIDPDGGAGVPFGTLVDDVRDVFQNAIQYPSVGDPRVSYRHLTIDDDPQSSEFADFFRHSLDVTLLGYETTNP